MFAEPHEYRPPAAASANRAGSGPAAFIAILRLLRVWRERAKERRELAMLSDREIADFRVPKLLAAEEARRWPWEEWDPQWREIETRRREAAARLRNL